MKLLEDLIRRYDRANADEADIQIKVKLKVINSLFEDLKGSEERIYMEEIITKFVEIMECQDGLYTSSDFDSMYVDRNSTALRGWKSYPNPVSKKLTADEIPWDPECPEYEEEKTKNLPPYLPPEGSFQTDNEVKTAFTNYLTYHVERKTKANKIKPFSVHTIYDYCSRIKVLWEIIYSEWLEKNKDTRFPLIEEWIQPGCTFLNAYNNLRTLQVYIDLKTQEINEIECGIREPFSEEELKKNPLNNPKNLRNTIAALYKFEEFRKKIEG